MFWTLILLGRPFEPCDSGERLLKVGFYITNETKYFLHRMNVFCKRIDASYFLYSSFFIIFEQSLFTVKDSSINALTCSRFSDLHHFPTFIFFISPPLQPRSTYINPPLLPWRILLKEHSGIRHQLGLEPWPLDSEVTTSHSITRQEFLHFSSIP